MVCVEARKNAALRIVKCQIHLKCSTKQLTGFGSLNCIRPNGEEVVCWKASLARQTQIELLICMMLFERASLSPEKRLSWQTFLHFLIRNFRTIRKRAPWVFRLNFGELESEFFTFFNYKKM